MEMPAKSPGFLLGLGPAGHHYSGPKRDIPSGTGAKFLLAAPQLMRGTFVMNLKNRVPLLQILLSVVLTISNFGCGGGSSSAALPPPPPPPSAISVTVSPTSATVPAGGTQPFTPTVANDPANKGVTWTVSCSAAPCGTASPTSTLSGTATTYTAPSTAPASNLTVTLTATSMADPTKSMPATITVPAISASVSPSSANVAVNAQQQFIGTVANDPSNGAITWTLTQNGTSCSPACGAIAPTSTASPGLTTYSAPASVPSPATATVTATSATDTTKSASSTVTVTPLPTQTTITYTVSAIASGTLGAATFTNALVTLEFVGDPSQAHGHPGTLGLWQNSGTGRVTIAGVGTATFSSGPLAFDEQGGPTSSCSSIPCVAGIGAGMPVGPTLLGITNTAFLTYDLNTPIGPVQGAPVITTSLTVGTTLGGLNFSSVGATGTFTATIP